MSEQHTPSDAAVLVGVDGSEASLSAVDWAARSAAELDRILFLCLVMPSDRAFWLPTEPILSAELRARGEQVLWHSRDRVWSRYPRLRVVPELVSGQPAEQLIRFAGPHDLLVVGAHGSGRMQRLMVGATSTQVAAHASGPVVVTRTDGFPVDGPIIAGVDNSEHADKVLAFAFETARRLDLPLQVIHAFTVPPMLPGHGMQVMTRPDSAAQLAVVETMNAIVDPWAEKYPEVPVCREIVRGASGRVLVDKARSASLIVVGSRGRGGFAGLLLGSVSQHVLALAHCPVAVAR